MQPLENVLSPSSTLKALLHYALFHSCFGFFLHFSFFSRIFYTNMLVLGVKSKKPKKITFFPILHYALGKKVSWLFFSSRFGTFEATKTKKQDIV